MKRLFYETPLAETIGLDPFLDVCADPSNTEPLDPRPGSWNSFDAEDEGLNP